MTKRRFPTTQRFSMRRNSAYALQVLVAWAAVTGCVSHHAVTSVEITPRTELSVSFATPQALTFSSVHGDTLAVDDVIELQGRMLKANADSITILATRADRAAGGVQRLGPGTTATFALADARMQEVRRHPGRTIAVVTVLVLSLALVIAVATYKEPPPPPPPEPKPK
jgi:hypothetical protein